MAIVRPNTVIESGSASSDLAKSPRRPRSLIGDLQPAEKTTLPTQSSADSHATGEQTAKENKLNQLFTLQSFRRQGSLLVAVLFIVGIVIPLSYQVGPLRLPLYRIIILVLLFPALLSLLTGRLGGVKSFDVLIISLGLWCFVAPFVGTQDAPMAASALVEAGGVVFLDTVGSYLIARYAIRDMETYRAMVRLLFLTLVVLLPFAAIEAVTGTSPLLQVLSKIGNVPGQIWQHKRLGLERAQVTFEHSILYGVFASSIIGLAVYSLIPTAKFFIKTIIFGIVSAAAVLSVSTGAVFAIMTQVMLMGWKWITASIVKLRKPWWMLAILIVVGYIAIDLMATRSPFHIVVNRLTFSSGSAYNRILIFEFGIQEVWRHPVFGIGYDDWERPGWLGNSMDNFWLLMAVRYGVTGFALFAIPFAIILLRLGRLRPLNRAVAEYRNGLLITLGGMILAACTVHYWNAVYAYFLFLFGAGIWMLEQPQIQKTAGR